MLRLYVFFTEKMGMKILGVEWQKNSTSGQEESAEQSGKHGEKTANTIKGQPDIALRFSVNHEERIPVRSRRGVCQ